MNGTDTMADRVLILGGGLAGVACAQKLGDEGIDVESVLIDDDVAVQDSTWTAGRRGVGATVLAEKLCGAAAEDGRPLDSLRDRWMGREHHGETDRLEWIHGVQRLRRGARLKRDEVAGAVELHRVAFLRR